MLPGDQWHRYLCAGRQGLTCQAPKGDLRWKTRTTPCCPPGTSAPLLAALNIRYPHRRRLATCGPQRQGPAPSTDGVLLEPGVGLPPTLRADGRDPERGARRARPEPAPAADPGPKGRDVEPAENAYAEGRAERPTPRSLGPRSPPACARLRPRDPRDPRADRGRSLRLLGLPPWLPAPGV